MLCQTHDAPYSSNVFSGVVHTRRAFSSAGARGLGVCASRCTYDWHLFNQRGGALEEAPPLLPRLLICFAGSDMTSSQNFVCWQLRQPSMPMIGNLSGVGECTILNLSLWHLLQRSYGFAADVQELSQ